jgi:hypothetical protein
MCNPFVFNGLFMGNVMALAANATKAETPLPTTR